MTIQTSGNSYFINFQQIPTKFSKCVKNLQRVQSTKYQSRPDKSKPSGAPRHLAGAFFFSNKTTFFQAGRPGGALPCRFFFQGKQHFLKDWYHRPIQGVQPPKACQLPTRGFLASSRLVVVCIGTSILYDIY